MACLSTEFITALLNHYFRNVAHPGIGDSAGLPASASPGNLYVALHAADPGDGGNQATNEVSYSGYGRAAVARGAGFAVNGKSVSPAAEVGFGKCTGGTATAAFWSVGTDATGSGHLILRGGIGALPRPFVANPNTDVVTCPSHSLGVGDRVVFWEYEGASLPGGLVKGTIYWVKTAPDGESFTLSATQTGATLDITSAGQGICQKLFPLVVTQNVTPKLETGTVIRFQ